jgi:hypothetical protein
MGSLVGLLTIVGIPSTIAISAAVNEQKKAIKAKKDERLMRKFTLTCWCEGKKKGNSNIHGGQIVVGDGKVCFLPL